MKVALYVGTHAGDAPLVRLGWALTRLVQKGEFGQVTHCEAIHMEYPDGTVAIASSSLRDQGVRTKLCVALNPAHWLIADAPQWSTARSEAFFREHDGEPYDSRGALATVLPGHHRSDQWFCNEAVGASVGLRTPECFHPAHFAAICFSFGRDITQEFFGERAALQGSGFQM